MVLHEPDSLKGTGCIVTQSFLVDWVVRALWRTFQGNCEITVGDVPLQTCDWGRMLSDAGYPAVQDQWRRDGISCQILDFRREWRPVTGKTFQEHPVALPGDPKGYVLVKVDKHSFLEPISAASAKFAVTDYSTTSTRSRHEPGRHEYLVPRSALECDLFVNVPKLKTHQKAGVTVALKNLIGINGDKSYLPHHRSGSPRFGGDEFKDERWWLGYAHSFTRRHLQGRFKSAFKAAHGAWLQIRKLAGLRQNQTAPDGSTAGLFVTDGAWYGNDTVWRTVLDVNQALFFGLAAGGWREAPRGGYLVVVDGIIGGEGNGPLRPVPKQSNILILGDNPVETDRACAHVMGFDPEKIPLLRRANYQGTLLENFSRAPAEVQWFDPRGKIKASGGYDTVPDLGFEPAPGWKGHIEKARREVRVAV